MEHLGDESISPLLDLDWLHQLILLVEREDLAELIVGQGDVTIIIRGRSYQRTIASPITVTVPQVVEPMPVKEVQTTLFPDDDRLFHITAPLTGTFYLRPRPDAHPFVTIGMEVEEGQVVALVEAMKFFNEVKSEVKGIVREILVKDGQLVKHGDTLIVLERLD